MIAILRKTMLLVTIVVDVTTVGMIISSGTVLILKSSSYQKNYINKIGMGMRVGMTKATAMTEKDNQNNNDSNRMNTTNKTHKNDNKNENKNKNGRRVEGNES